MCSSAEMTIGVLRAGGTGWLDGGAGDLAARTASSLGRTSDSIARRRVGPHHWDGRAAQGRRSSARSRRPPPRRRDLENTSIGRQAG